MTCLQAGWFLLAHARAVGDAALAARAVRVIDDNFAWGWDDGAGTGGGLLYFRDIEGFSPTQLEWNMCGGDCCYTRSAAISSHLPPVALQEALVASQRSYDRLCDGVPADPRRRALGAVRKGECAALHPVVFFVIFSHVDAAQVASWSYTHLVDSAAGEWWGYADRAGTVTHRFKGGPYKGCFHVPRALLYVDRVLSAVLQEGGPQ